MIQKTNTNSSGPTYWRSLNELANTPGVQASIANEFPGYDAGELLAETSHSESRRKFLQLAGASMALAGVTLTGCRRWPKENVVEQVSRSPGRIPGEPEHYATCYELGGFSQPLLVTTYDGRPIKIEGNPLHASCKTFGGKLGASTLTAQATLLEMYDPERSRGVVTGRSPNRQAASWTSFTAFAKEHFGKFKGAGDKLALLIEETRSPTTVAQIEAFKKAYPSAKIYSYEPISRDNELVGSKLAFGKPLRQKLDLAQADVVVSFDADLFAQHPNALRMANDWSQRRRGVDAADKSMNRMYVVESRFSTTGAAADERTPATVRKIEQLVLQLAYKAGLESGQAGLSADDVAHVEAMWSDLSAKAGKGVVVGGYHLRPEILAVIACINDKLKAFGSTITLLPETDRPTHVEQIKALVTAISAGSVDTLVIVGGNPVYDAPADLNFSKAISGVATTIHLSLYYNETSDASLWHVNRAHYLESWGDGVAYDGSVVIQQPMIEPLFAGKTSAEFLAVLAGDEKATAQSVFYATWAGLLKEQFVATSKTLQKALHDGFAGGAPVSVTSGAVTKPTVSFPPAAGADTFELRFVPDYKMYDGRYANNGWLQECPDPITKITWDNAALISYADAQTLGVQQGDNQQDLLEISTGVTKLTLPAFIVPGQPKGVVTLPLGYARQIAGAVLLTDRPGSIGSNVGYDTYSLRTTESPNVVYGASVVRTGASASLASTQTHFLIEPTGEKIYTKRVGEKSQPGKIVHESTFKAFKEDSYAPHAAAHKLLPLQLFPSPYSTPQKHEHGPKQFNEPHAWGMTIDMNSCIGCNACVVACQAENNIPVVGKDQVIVNREMHWLRIDRYFKGTQDDPNPQITFQPMMCVHCENAPCEQVCPVAATVHDAEGLNTMIYNRCIGTRYCANNCPYKVRRFNYLDYQSRIPGDFKWPWLGIPDQQQEQSIDKIKALVFNPEVTVRIRGVMEKCTYCTQRIKRATINKKNAWSQAGNDATPKANGRPQYTVDDFDVVTACQQVCPTESIVFGDLNDKTSLVTQLQQNKRSYAVLEELNNRPRSFHMAKVRNPVNEPEPAKEAY